MALLIVNPETLDFNVKVGVLETYSPDEEVMAIHGKVEDLRQKTREFLVDLIGIAESDEEAWEKLKADEDKEKQWMDFLNVEYKAALDDIMDDVKTKNVKICPGYDMVLKAKEKKKK